MGFKRPFDEEEFQEFSFKHPKQHDCGNKLTLLAEVFLPYEASQKDDIPGEAEGIFRKFQFGEELENASVNVASDLANEEFENSAPLSGVTSTTSEEDAGSGAAFCSSLSPEYFEFNFPRRTSFQFQDTYLSLLNSSPRRGVPLGPNHQADVPSWDPQVIKKDSLGFNYIVDDDGEEKLMGACVIPMPDSKLSSHDGVKASDGRPDCGCSDDGSVICVRQHVKETREKLRETLGHENFVDLGFSVMGEEVAHKWTEEEERVFHEVVYCNPVSLGKNFWEHLPMTFPSRTKKELVSYYFNVFMLRRRAAQNRSNLLEIDSDDDDESRGNDGAPFGARGEDEGSAVESFIDQDVRMDHEDDFLDDDDGDDDEDDDDDDGDSDRDGDVGDATGTYGGKGHISKAQIEKSLDDCRFDLVVRHVDKISRSIRGDFDVQEDSCTSTECQPYMTDSYGRVGVRAAIQENGIKTDHRKCLYGNGDGSNDVLGPGYILEPCEAKFWDATYPMGLMKGVDLLSTRNMIEEIFGPCTWNSKSSNDKSIG